MNWFQDAMDGMRAAFTDASRQVAAVLFAALQDLAEERQLEKLEIARWESEGGAL